jgi:ABC-2 type transport system permease protein
MKVFIAFVNKEFKHIFRDTRTLIILFGMPVVLVTLFGFAISTEIKNSKIAVLDNAKDAWSSRLINKINASKYFTVTDHLADYGQIERKFKAGAVKVALVIPQNFGKDLLNGLPVKLQVVSDATDPNTANIVQGYLDVTVQDFLAENGIAQGFPLDVQTRMRYNPEVKSVYMFVPGIIVIILMLVSTMMTSITVAREKELGTMEILLVSPLKPFLIIMGKIMPYVLLSLINAVTILLLGFFVFRVPMLGSYWLLGMEILLFIAVCLMLGVFISDSAETQQNALMMSLLGLMLPTILLSGFIFPIASMPLVLQWLSDLIPAKWFIIILKSIMLKGAGFQVVQVETYILLFTFFVLMFLSVKKFKTRLE